MKKFICSALLILLFSVCSSQTENGNGQIVFYSTRDGHHEIYVMEADGSNLRRLTFGEANNLCPAWSPDGEKIVYESDRDGNEEIYVMNADGGNQVRLTFTPFPEHHFAWSPDGTRIVFKAHRPENKDIYVINSDGSNLVRLTNDPAVDVTPDWSPDGSQITFCSDRNGNREIYIMNSDGSNQRRLTNNSSLDIFPKWSPDGKRILFLSHRDGEKDIYMMDADGGHVRRLTTQEGVDEGGCWSPDGKHIVFQTNRDGNYEIYIMDADGSNQRRLTNHPAGEYWPGWAVKTKEQSDFPVLTGPYLGQKPPGMTPEIFAPGVVSTENHEHSSLIISPDRKEIFWSVISAPLSDNSSHKIVFMKYENNHWAPPKTASFSGQCKDDFPFMSPDGNKIYFCSNRPFPGKSNSKEYELWFVERTNTGWSEPRLLGHPFTEENKTWQPSITNNDVIYFLGYLEGVQKKYGIYRSRFINGQFSKPELLDKSINTEYPDWCPYIAPDESYLIFSSKRPGGYGGFDLYISYQKNDGSWVEPQNLGSEINQKYHERFPGISPDGKYLFFTRPNGENNGDIYWVNAKIIEELK